MNDRRGYVLVAVLMLASLLVLFIGVAGQRILVADAAVRSTGEDVVADAAVRGAIEVFYARSGGRFGDVAGATVALPGVTVEFTAADEARRIDLNMAKPELIAGLFRTVGVGAADADVYAATIVDWRRDPTQPDTGKQQHRVAAHGVIEHFAELDGLTAIPRSVIAAIAPYATVTSLTGKVDPLIAPPAVVAALPGFDPGRIADFLAERSGFQGPFDTLMKRYGIVSDHVSKDGSTASRVRLTVRIGSHRVRGYEVVVATVPSDDEPFRYLAWNGNVAPAASAAGP